MPSERIVELIRKLQEVRVDRGATPAEAENAAAHVRRLLEKYQLSLLDVEAGKLHDGMGVEELEIEGQTRHEWLYDLAGACSRPLDCDYCMIRRRRDHRWHVAVQFLGFSSDVQIARHLFVYLSRLLNEMADRDGRMRGRSGANLIAFRKAYISGAAWAIERRLTEDKKRNQQANSDCRALVAIKGPAVKAFAEEQSPNCKVRKGKSPNDEEAMLAGHEAGKHVKLQEAIEQNEQRKAIEGQPA